MALPQVGLEAVIEGLAQFQAGAAAIQKSYESLDQGANQVQRTTSGFGSVFGSLGSSLGSIGGQFVGLGQNVMRFGAIAGGVALGGVVALGAGITALGVLAVGEFAKYERMSLSIQNLVAHEISQGQVVEQQIQTRTALTKKEAEELAKLPQKITDETLSRQTLAAQIQEQQQKIIQLTAAYGENGLNVQVAKARLAEMQNEYVKSGAAIDTMNGRITELNSKNGALVTALEKVRVGQMSMADAMTQAGPKAQELLKWIQLLAIQSPFTQEGIANAFQTAMAYGFTVKEAKRLTEAEVDYAAATGKSVETTNMIALALGQMQAKGKVSGQEIIQLTNAGVGVNKILENMGFTLDDVSKGLVDSDKFIEAVISDMEIFRGSAKQQSETFAGLFSSLEDLKSIGLREFFTGTFQAIQPYLADFVSFLTDAALTSGGIRSIGDAIGKSVGKALTTIFGLVKQFQTFGPEGLFAALGFAAAGPFITAIQQLFNLIIGQMPSAQSMFDGFSSTITYLQGTLFPMLTQAVNFVIDNFVEFKGALIGIGAVLGAGVFAALVAGLVSLITPMGLIIAGAALLGAAWAGNWGDIQGKTAAAWAVIQPILQELWGWLSVNIPAAITTASTFWSTTLLPALQTVSNFLTTVIVPAWLEVWTWLNANIPAAVQTSANAWSTTLLPALTTVGNFISTNLTPFFASLGNVITAVVNVALTASAGLWQNVLFPALQAVGGYLAATLGPAFQAVSDFLVATFNPTVQELGTNFLPAITAGFNGIVTAIQSATTWLNTLAANITALQLPPWLTPGSPTPFELGLLGIATALQGPLLIGLTTFAGLMTTSLIPMQLGWQTLGLTIDNITLISFPTLTAGLLALSAFWIAQTILMQTQIFILDTTTQSIYLITLPALWAATTTTQAVMTAMAQTVTAAINQLISTIGAAGTALINLGNIGRTTGTTIASAMNSAASGIKTLTEIVKKATDAFLDMAAAAREAAAQAAAAGSASGAATGLGFSWGIGFASGTPLMPPNGKLGLGATVPPGFPNDSFGPFFAQSGEQMLITPRGLSIDELISQRLSLIAGNVNGPVQTPAVGTGGTTNSTNNYFQMTVNSGAAPEAVIQQFQIAKAMLT